MDAAFSPKKIVIYGVGLLGGSLCLALRNTGYTGTIVGVSSPSTIDAALKAKAIDAGFPRERLAEALVDADILFLCPPVNTIKSIIANDLHALRDALPPGLLITDIGSTKEDICREAERAIPGIRFIGGHPMTGSEKTGFGEADAFIFQNARYVLTPPPDTDRCPREFTDAFALFLKNHLGCQTITMDADVHDRIVSITSHMPHLLAVALMKTAMERHADLPELYALAAGAFRDMTRISMSPWGMWFDIITQNRVHIKDSLDCLILNLQEIQRMFAEGKSFADPSVYLSKWFNDAATERATISFAGKGFEHSIFDIVVTAPDKPGVLARLTTVLASHNLNIKDIEVLKVRENEGGTIRLGFDSPLTAARATAIIADLGFTARERTA